MDHKDVMRAIELLGKEVIPAIREIKQQPQNLKAKLAPSAAGLVRQA